MAFPSSIIPPWRFSSSNSARSDVEDSEIPRGYRAVVTAIGRPDSGREAFVCLRTTGWDSLRRHPPGKAPRWWQRLPSLVAALANLREEERALRRHGVG